MPALAATSRHFRMSMRGLAFHTLCDERFLADALANTGLLLRHRGIPPRLLLRQGCARACEPACECRLVSAATSLATRCLRCAGAPRRPTSGSGLSLLIPS